MTYTYSPLTRKLVVNTLENAQSVCERLERAARRERRDRDAVLLSVLNEYATDALARMDADERAVAS